MSEPRRLSIFGSGLWAFFAALAMLGWIAWGNLREDEAAANAPASTRGTVSSEEQAALSKLLSEAGAVLRSLEFKANLVALSDRYPAIYARAQAQDVTASRTRRRGAG